MRLIDADKLIADMEHDIAINEDLLRGTKKEDYRRDLIDAIDGCYYVIQLMKENEPVKAIPVEWIETWYKKAMKTACDGADVSVDKMLDEWENEK